MRAYKVVAAEGDVTLGFRFGSTQANAKEQRDELVTQFAIKKSAVTIEEVEIPVAKAELLAFINELAAGQDAVEDASE